MIVCGSGTPAVSQWHTLNTGAFTDATVERLACVERMQKEAHMEQNREPAVLELAADEMIDIEKGKGLEVESVSGAIWITQAHDGRDIVLRPGDAFTLDRRGVAVVSALTPATVKLTTEMARAPRIHRHNPARAA
jgi:hypothetical protein